MTAKYLLSNFKELTYCSIDLSEIGFSLGELILINSLVKDTEIFPINIIWDEIAEQARYHDCPSSGAEFIDEWLLWAQADESKRFLELPLKKYAKAHEALSALNEVLYNAYDSMDIALEISTIRYLLRTLKLKVS